MINNSSNNHHRRRRHCSCKKNQFPTMTSGFLDCCFLCRQKLLPGKDIFMYEGDKGFCSEECRCRQILMDEEQSMLDAGKRSFATAINPKTTASPPSAPSSDPPSRHPKSTRNHARDFAF